MGVTNSISPSQPPCRMARIKLVVVTPTVSAVEAAVAAATSASPDVRPARIDEALGLMCLASPLKQLIALSVAVDPTAPSAVALSHFPVDVDATVDDLRDYQGLGDLLASGHLARFAGPAAEVTAVGHHASELGRQIERRLAALPDGDRLLTRYWLFNNLSERDCDGVDHDGRAAWTDMTVAELAVMVGLAAGDAQRLMAPLRQFWIATDLQDEPEALPRAKKRKTHPSRLGL